MNTLKWKKTVIRYYDPGHSWGKISKTELNSLGLQDKISSCSYQSKRYVYLEEDCDLRLYLDVMQNKGCAISFETRYTKNNRRSVIRTYQPYEAIK